MKNILFIAPPAGGKGTQSELLVEKYGYNHISTGDLLREIDKSTPLGQEISSLISEGKFVSDELIFQLLEEKMNSGCTPFILDGVPRNLKQASMLESMLNKLDLSIGAVINLDVPYELLVKRATGRISCPKCKATYNKFFKPTIKEGICDKCGMELVTRDDDNEETFKNRYDTYLENTLPLIEYYKEKGILHTITETDANVVLNKVVEVVKND